MYTFTFTNTTSEPSHHNHTIIPHSNHHTKIILKSIELRNIQFFDDVKSRYFLKKSFGDDFEEEEEDKEEDKEDDEEDKEGHET